MQTQQLMMRMTRVKVMKVVLEFLLRVGGGARNRVDTLVFDVIILCMSAVFPRTFNGFDFNPSILKKLF